MHEVPAAISRPEYLRKGAERSKTRSLRSAPLRETSSDRDANRSASTIRRPIDRLRAELKFEPRRLRALRTAFFKKFRGVDAALAELPADVRDEFARRVEFHPLAVEQRVRFGTRRRDEAGVAHRGRTT